MLFEKIDFENKSHIEKFIITKKFDCNTWEDYYNSYNYALKCILEEGFSKNYDLNCKAKCILFLIRHSIELCLKLNLYNKKLPIPNSHIFKDLISAYPEDYKFQVSLIKILHLIDLDKDGSCYRYVANKDTNANYFTHEDVTKVYEILQLHWSLNNTTEFEIGTIFPEMEFSKIKKWDLTFHLGEANLLGPLRTQYDQCIEVLVVGIIEDRFDVNEIFVPLMFLIRHSLELALKSNIIEVQNFSTLIKGKDYSNEHSLARLFNCYHDYLTKVDFSKLSQELNKEIEIYLIEYAKLNEVIHQLDKNSQHFRFPTNVKGDFHNIQLSKISFIDVLKLYYYTDPFLTFSNNVLEENGILV
ncbi:MAG: hypothetical protein IMY72_06165 [Bacteroidetes bacterium]|nr:hypothetical protein [Bacteroidota bacterium]